MRLFQSDSVSSPNPAAGNTDLGPLYEPADVPFTFETIGWQVVGILLLLAVGYLAYRIYRHWYRNRYRREALTRLNQLSADEKLVSAVFIILKNTAMQVYGRNRTGSLSGKEWLEFLENTGKGVRFTTEEKAIMDALYRDVAVSPETGNALIRNAQKWINTHAG